MSRPTGSPLEPLKNDAQPTIENYDLTTRLRPPSAGVLREGDAPAEAAQEESDHQQALARNVVSNWLSLAASVVYALVITPVVIAAVRTELYGVWSFLNGLLMYSELLYLGLGSAIIKYVAQLRARGETIGIARLGSIVALIYSAIGLICCLALFVVSGAIPSVFADPLPPDAALAATRVCALLGVQVLFIFVGSAFSGIVCGHNRYDLVNIVNIACTLVRAVATLLFVQPEQDPLLMLGIITAAVSGVQTTILVALSFWYVRDLRIRPVWPHLGELKLLYGFGVQTFFISFAVRLISYTDTTVIGVMLGAAAVTLYALPLQLVEYSRHSVSALGGVLLPRLSAMAARGEGERIRAALIVAMRATCFLGGWTVALLISLGPDFLNVWLGLEFGAEVRWVLAWLGIALFAQVVAVVAPQGFYQALHLVGLPAAVLTVEAVLNLALSLSLARPYGIAGVAAATALPAVLVSMWIMPWQLCRRLDLPVRTLFAQGVAPGALVLIVTLGSGWIGGQLLGGGSYASLAAQALLTVPLALLMFRLTFPADERDRFTRLIRKSSLFG